MAGSWWWGVRHRAQGIGMTVTGRGSDEAPARAGEGYRLARSGSAVEPCKQLAPLELVQPTPNAVGLANAHGVLEAGLPHPALLADRLGAGLALESLVLALKRAWWEKNHCLRAAARGLRLPCQLADALYSHAVRPPVHLHSTTTSRVTQWGTLCCNFLTESNKSCSRRVCLATTHCRYRRQVSLRARSRALAVILCAPRFGLDEQRHTFNTHDPNHIVHVDRRGAVRTRRPAPTPHLDDTTGVQVADCQPHLADHPFAPDRRGREARSHHRRHTGQERQQHTTDG